MTRGGLGRTGWVRVALVLLALCSFWPVAHLLPVPIARASAGPLHDMVQPPVSALQGAFALAGQDRLPDGYPQPSGDWIVPSTLLKAIAWTESGWRQFAAPGRTLVSFDGGYGLMQITSGMESGGLPSVVRSAIAHNFLYNISYGAHMLVQKLLHTPNIGNDDPTILEHWYYALWAYNGWGWVNNPNNPRFSRIGTPATNAATFPYQERVFYWLAHPPRDAAGAPLWPAIPVTLPSADLIGVDPQALPEVATPHTDLQLPAPPLNLGNDDGATFLGDVSVPDGTVVAPGRRFRKIWLLRNHGAHSWGAGYSWAPSGGTPLNATRAATVPLTPPLADVQVGADLVAPRRPGTYRQYWQMRGPDGHPFGVKAWVQIRVRGTVAQAVDGAATPRPADATGSPPTPSTAALVAASTPYAVLASSNRAPVQHAQRTTGDDAVYAGDVTVPDGTVFKPGQRFVKTWRIKNIGTTAWVNGYRWHFEAGTQFSKLASVAAPNANPGITVNISVPMTAPSATGVYTSFWQMTNAGGQLFGHQAWVRIVVRGSPASPAMPTSTATRTVAVQPTPSVSPTPAPPTPTPTPPAPTPRAPAPPAAAPTAVLPGGNGQLVASPWIGALTYRTYFAAGSTAHGMQERLALFYPGTGVAHVRLTLYRPDGAQRMLEFAMHAGQRSTFALNRIAPNTDLAVAMEADRKVVIERSAYGTRGVLGEPGAARTARLWYFPAVDGTPAGDQQIVFFNPHDEPARVTVTIGRATAGCCARTTAITVPPQQQFTYHLGTSSTLYGPLTLFSSAVVAAERLVVAPSWSAVTAFPGTVTAARHWYLPDARSGPGGTSVTLFNPGASPALATVHLALDEGPGRWEQRTIPPFTQITMPINMLAVSPAMGVEVDANLPIIAGAVLLTGAQPPAFYLGSSVAAPSWLVLGTTAGRGSSQTVAVLNPNDGACAVSFKIVDGKGKVSTWTISVPGHSRYARVIDGLVPADGGTLMVHAADPVTVGRTIVSASGAATSMGTAIAAP